MSTIADVRALVPSRDFSVALDGTLTRSPDVDEHLARSVHYACRMAGQLNTVLGIGELLRMRTSGATEVDASVGWGMGGECLLRAHVRSGPPPLPMLPPSPSGGDPHRSGFVAAQLDAVLAETHAHTGAEWTVVLRHDLVPLRVAGALTPEQLAVLGSRVLGMLNGLGVRDLGSVTLDHAQGTLVVAPLGAHALSFFVGLHDTPVVRAAVERTRTMLDGLDLASATPLTSEADASADAAPAPPTASTAAVDEVEVDWVQEEWLEPEFAFPVGARFAGMSRAARPPKPRRRKGKRRA